MVNLIGKSTGSNVGFWISAADPPVLEANEAEVHDLTLRDSSDESSDVGMQVRI